MQRDDLLAAVLDVGREWERTIGELGAEGLEQPDAVGAWRVRDVLAHFNGWDRWQLVQLRCAFTGETPADRELHGPVDFPPNDDMREDAMNAMFVEGNRPRPTQDVIGDWRELTSMRAEWVAAASQDQLDELIGSDWASGSPRILRLVSEVAAVQAPHRVWERIMDQVGHQRAHLDEVRAWMATTRPPST